MAATQCQPADHRRIVWSARRDWLIAVSSRGVPLVGFDKRGVARHTSGVQGRGDGIAFEAEPNPDVARTGAVLIGRRVEVAQQPRPVFG